MRGAIVIVFISGCAGTLGHPGERAPAGVAYCEPTAIRVDTLDADGEVARSVTARCAIDGAVSLSDSSGFAVRLERREARELWRLVDEVGPLASCDRAGAPRFRITIVGDDTDEIAVCPLGGDPRFDRVLGAVLHARHRVRERVRWMDIVVARR